MKIYVKVILLFLIIGLVTNDIKAQNKKGKADDFGRIVLNSYVSPQVEGLPSSAKRMLSNKLSQVASKNGMGGSCLNPKFIITPNITVLTKDLTPTAPPMTALTLEITFYIGDGVEGTLFANNSIEVKGVGTNETKAYISALKQIKPAHPDLKNLIEEGKTKIIEYYNSKCDFIQKEASAKADKKEYDEAIAGLLAVPEVCKDCYMACQDLTSEIYKMKMENECKENIQKAIVAKTNNEWDEAATLLTTILPDVSCFDDAQGLLEEIEDHRCSEALGKANGAWANRDSKLASSFLSEISSDSKCAEEAKQLFTQISGKLDADEKKEWDLEYEKYNRNQTERETNSANNRDLANRDQTYKENQGYELEQARIKAAKAIGVAYGNNQPKKIVYNTRSWF
jgi:hypothetical protein|tara:strand:+ start:4749 stop:5939 length:1191 start_codon:yes stop_codon:yes gene_type:complete